MALVNEHFLKLPESQLSAQIAKKINAFKITHPEQRLIDLSTDNASLPLPPACIEAMHRAIDEQAQAETFHGYGPKQGYDFLITAILKHDYAARGINFSTSEVFISDGAKSDIGNIGELLRWDNSMAIADPSYPVYVDCNILCGRAGELNENGKWSNVTYLPCTEENHFIPAVPDHRVDLIYLCSPNNPTGKALTIDELKKWVDYALSNDTLIVFDSTYEAYIDEPRTPHSIYEIKGARKVAIEVRSFSKTAGFSGMRCGYTVIPKEVTATDISGQRVPLNPLWNRRQHSKTNGVNYVVQRGAEAIYTAEGHKQVKETIAYYKANAALLRNGLHKAGFNAYGGFNAPFLWLKAPRQLSAWKFFDLLLYDLNIVSTPGIAFGPNGEGYVRLSAFARRDDCSHALQLMQSMGSNPPNLKK